MEDLEIRALATSPCPPTLWKRFVDDTFTIIKKSHKEAFLEHLNSINNNIQFTCEEPCDDGSIPFLDMLIIPDEEGRLNTTVCRKPTHSDQYLHWDSHHAIPSKYSVIGTLYHRAKTICSGPQQLQKEEQHLYKSLKRCKYPTWVLNRVRLRSQAPAPKKNKGNTKNSDPNNSRDQKPHIIAPYHQGLSESFKRTCKKYGTEAYPILKKSGVIYRYKCDRVGCDEEYIGESARNFAERFKEHLQAPSPIYDHSNISGHTVTIENFSILGRED